MWNVQPLHLEHIGQLFCSWKTLLRICISLHGPIAHRYTQRFAHNGGVFPAGPVFPYYSYRLADINIRMIEDQGGDRSHIFRRSHCQRRIALRKSEIEAAILFSLRREKTEEILIIECDVNKGG